MVCYVIPLSVALILFVSRKILRKESASLQQLNLLLAGGAVMLVIDHLWNGELLLIGKNLASDLLLGFLMTLGVLVFWGLMLVANKSKAVALTETKA